MQITSSPTYVTSRDPSGDKKTTFESVSRTSEPQTDCGVRTKGETSGNNIPN